MKSSRNCFAFWGWILCALQVGMVHAQSTYEVAVTDMTYQRVYKNWLLIPQEVDLRVNWTILQKEMVNGREVVIYNDPAEMSFSYQVYIYEGDSETPEIREVNRAGLLDLAKRKIGERLVFKVRAFSPDGEVVSESSAASILIGDGDENQYADLFGRDWLYYLNPGRWQLLSLGKPEVYDKSTQLGKLAFIFLSVTSCFSFLVLLYYSTRTLYLGNVFPFRRSSRGLLWSLSLSCDKAYSNRLTEKFKFILKAWETIATKSRRVTDRAVKSIPNGLSSTEKMASVDVACMEYWTTDGDKAIGTIEDIIRFPNQLSGNGKKSPDDLLTELVINIEDCFHDLVTPNGHMNGEGHSETMEKLIEEIYEPVVIDEKPLSRFRRWLLRSGIFDLQKGLTPFPTSKIIRAGLEIHRMNGYRWLKPSEEVKRAFENRASIEIEYLRRKSKIEWFWNYGALAPLVGLFGTVTGITDAFQQLASTSATPDFVYTIQQLSSGIFEALWTTIFGLANGILFMVLYYYFKHKLDWIYAKWEEIYISITEKL
jgi:hypothetical protein